MDDQEPLPHETPLADQVHLHDPYALTFSALPEDVEKEMAEAILTIRAMYDAGTPLYTKEILASVSQQIEAANDRGCQKIFVKGIDGKTVELGIETGLVVWPTGEPNLEYVLTKPEIEFRSYQEMISTTYNFKPSMAYSTLRISHYVEWRDHITKESLRPSPANSLNDTRDNFLKVQQLWEDSFPRRELESILKLKISPQTNTVVAFGLGSISDRAQDNQASGFQHALTLTVRDIAQINDKTQEVKCYSQDPIYNSVDKSVLRENGMSVLANPRAFLKVNDSSVVISCSPDIPVKQIVADIARPAAMIWNQVSRKIPDSELIRTDEDSWRVEQMIRDYYEDFTFPGEVDIFGNLKVYIRKADRDQWEATNTRQMTSSS